MLIWDAVSKALDAVKDFLKDVFGGVGDALHEAFDPPGPPFERSAGPRGALLLWFRVTWRHF